MKHPKEDYTKEWYDFWIDTRTKWALDAQRRSERIALRHLEVENGLPITEFEMDDDE